MTLEYFERVNRAKGNIKAADMAQDLRAQFGDVPLPSRERLTDPDAVTSTFQAIWQVRQEILRQKGIDLEFSLPECPYTKEELLKLEEEGRRVGYLPVELSTQKSRHLMAKIWPQMESHSVEVENQVTNEIDVFGWFDYEASIDAPYTGTNEAQLKDEFKRQGRKGLNLNQYIVAGQDSKLFTGEYLDQNNTWVRLLGSRSRGDVVYAGFRGGGRLLVYSDLSPRNHAEDLGGRSSGVPKNA